MKTISRANTLVSQVLLLLSIALNCNLVNAAENDVECLPFREAAKQAEEAKAIAIVKGNLIVESRIGVAQWIASKHDFGGQEMSGAQLDQFITRMSNPDIQREIAGKLRAKGVSEASIEKGQREMQEFIEIKKRQRKRMVVDKMVGVFLMGSTINRSGYLLMGDKPLSDQEGGLCRKADFVQINTYRYKNNAPPLFNRDSNLFKLMEQYKKDYRYGILGFALTPNYQKAVVFMGNPEVTDGNPNGVILFGNNSSEDKAEILGDLSEASYGVKLDQSRIPEN
jgi:hypothetical protein